MATHMKWDIQWSPIHTDIFFTYGADRTDLNQYVVEKITGDFDTQSLSKSQGQQISRESIVKTQATKLDLYMHTKSDLSLIKV